MFTTLTVKPRSVREQVSADEWQKRVDLAACYRLLDLYGMSEMSANHVSTRVPGEDNAFLINPHGMLYDQMHAALQRGDWVAFGRAYDALGQLLLKAAP